MGRGLLKAQVQATRGRNVFFSAMFVHSRPETLEIGCKALTCCDMKMSIITEKSVGLASFPGLHGMRQKLDVEARGVRLTRLVLLLPWLVMRVSLWAHAEQHHTNCMYSSSIV